MAFSLRDHLGDTLNTLALRAYQKGLELACHVAPRRARYTAGRSRSACGQILVNWSATP